MYKEFVLLALAVPFFLTGCWDKKDPEDRAFIITLGVDAAENGCHFTFAPANIETGAAEIYAAESETLSGAVAQVDTYTSRKAGGGQLETVIVGESLWRDSARLDARLGELARRSGGFGEGDASGGGFCGGLRGKGHEGGQQDRSVPLGFL